LAPFIDVSRSAATEVSPIGLLLKHVLRGGAARPRVNAIYHGKRMFGVGGIALGSDHRHRVKM
jgi:hypothetical protein